MLDVAVIGGGPAGCATALSLARHAPHLSVAVIEASRYAEPRMGETLAPVARTMLEHLAVWNPFESSVRVEVHGTAAAWGSPHPHHNDFLFSVTGPGWHIERTAFDALLAREAERRGVTVIRGTRLVDACRTSKGWRLRLSRHVDLEARWVADATGPTAAFARRQGASSVELDQLVGFGQIFEGCEPSEPHTLVEAFSDGWWYSATLPGGRRVATCMTDPDLARMLRLRDRQSWDRVLKATELIRETVRGARPRGDMLVRSARSCRLDPPAGDGWIAAGDAASSFDPLSSQGIVKALRSGIFASYALSDLLAGDDGRGLDRYRAFIAEEFDAYAKTRSAYYAAERRWPHNQFWSRRHHAELLSSS